MKITAKIRLSFGAACLLFGLVPLVAAAEQPAFFVDYVLATSTNQYIDTGLVNSGDYKAELTFTLDKRVTKTALLGCKDRKFVYVNSDGYLGTYYLGTAKLVSTPASVRPATGVKYRMAAELAAGIQTASVVRVSTGEVLATYANTVSGYTDKNAPFYLLNYYNEDTKAAHTSVCSTRLYGCKIWRKVTGESDYALVRDFRPAVSQDGRAGLWDAVEEKMYYPPSGEALPFGGAVSTWTGGGADGKWSTAANWDVPPTTDHLACLVFQPGESTLSTENDIEGLKIDNIAVVGTNGTFNLTGDKKLTFYSYSGDALSAVHSNLTLNVSTPMDFKTDANFKYRGNATFNGDFTFADGISFTINPTWKPGKDNYKTTFAGAFCGPNAKVEISYGQNDARSTSFSFSQPVNIGEMTLGYDYLNNKIYFNASGNAIGKLNVTGHYVYFRAENPLTPGTVVNWFNCDVYSRWGAIYFSQNGGNTVELDRVIGDNGPAVCGDFPSKAQTMTTEKTSNNTTLYLRGTDNASCYALCNTGLSLVWDPTGDYTQEFRDRAHTMNGTITVKGGTFKSGGTNSFPNVSKVIICDGARFEAESTLPFTSGSVDLEIYGSGKLALPAGTNCAFKSVLVDELPVPGTNYVGVGHAGEGKVEASWLEGDAVITTPEVHATFWKATADGDWGEADNWTDGVPSASLPGYVSAKGGDYTVTVKATDVAPGDLKIINNGAGTATVKMAGEVTSWKNVNCEISRGGCLEVPTDAKLNCDDSSAKFTVKGGTFRVSGGLATFDGAEKNAFTGAFSVTGDATHTGVVSVTAGTLRCGPAAADNRLKVLEYGRLDVSGSGALKASCMSSSDSPLTLDGGAFNVSGNGLYTTDYTNRTFRAQFGSGETVFGGDSTLLLNETPKGSVCKFYVTPCRAGETATVTFRDQARIALSNGGACDGAGIGDTANATGIVVLASSARHMSGSQTLSPRLTIGSASESVGILRMEDGYFPAAGSRGILVGGSPRGLYGTVVANSFGVLSVSGGCLYLKGRDDDNQEAYMAGMTVGDASNVIESKQTSSPYADTDRIAEGLLELSGTGIITNLSGVTMIGGGRGTGLFRQTGGTYEQRSTSMKSPFVVGNAGGFGTYLLSGGEAHLQKDMYVGGTFTNRIASGGYMATYGYPVNCHTATGVVQVTGGALSVAGNLNVGWDGRGSLEMVGAQGQVSVGGDLVLSNTVVSAEVSTGSALSFTCDENGAVSPITVNGKLVNTPGTKMKVDLGDFDGVRRNVWLLRYAGLEGPAPEVELVKPAESGAEVRFSAVGCRVVYPHGAVLILR